ncbi:MAG: hypothetical protein FWE82_03455 [Defluviitaleaceae bacterium]|nr:hypothetical protein [Defluviitaleaceae bacterium]
MIRENILSVIVAQDFGEAVAEFSYPNDGTGYGNAVGRLRIQNMTPNIYGRLCDVCSCGHFNSSGIWIGCGCNHPYVSVCPERIFLTPSFTEITLAANIYNQNLSAAADRVAVSPVINAFVHRRNLGDSSYNSASPSNRNQNFIDKSGTGITQLLVHESPLSRNYSYYEWRTGSTTDSDGNITYYRYRVLLNAGASAVFNAGVTTHRQPFTVKVYNGKNVLPQLPEIERSIDGNVPSEPVREINWQSKELPVSVVRMMYGQNESGALTGRQIIEVNQPRHFVAQNTAELSWDINEHGSMDAMYYADRIKAANRDYRLSSGQKAVFASDLSFQNLRYPIKSGYFFNPAGSYTFTLSTEMFKQTQGGTPEHEALLHAIIQSFCYESDMVYINPSTRAAVGIDNRPAAATIGASGLDRISDRLAIARVGDNGLVQIGFKIDKREVRSEVLHHEYPNQYDDTNYGEQISERDYENGTGWIDKRFKYILEGYSESGTADSRSLYRYTEYVRSGQNIYLVTETTTVTITVNPSNQNVYTHLALRNGNYRIRAYFSDIELFRFNRGEPGFQLDYINQAAPWLAGHVLDVLYATVVGSMFDDYR